MPDGISLSLIPPETLAPDDQRQGKANLKDAAGKFEAMLIAQMLKSARKTDSSGWTGEADQAASSMMDMAEQQFADMLGAQGGLGLAKLVMTQLGPKK
jgi:Rod binding domain-containing protein